MMYLTSIIAALMLNLASPAGYNVGDKVSDFELKNVDGKMIKLSDYSDEKGVIVVFTCNHCPYAKAYESRIMDLDKKYASKGYPVVAINPNDPVKEPEDSPEGMIKRAKAMNYSFPYLFDATQDVAKTFGATRTPHIYLLQNTPSGFKVSYIGAIDDNTDDPSAVTNKYLENAITSLQKGEAPSPNFTKAIGCTIKWKQ
ncbi:MAG: thioredoxin family protein [Fimbriimonadaceae bacterium]|nr:thioredoxin family protein [Chitinophagales bacterium]